MSGRAKGSTSAVNKAAQLKPQAELELTDTGCMLGGE